MQAPALLIVGELDEEVIKLNQKTTEALQGEFRLEIIPGATHLFEERGKLEKVAMVTGEWFITHLDWG